MKYDLLTFVFCLFANLLQAQTIKTYSGPYENGKATYQYYEDNNGERIYNGPFTYKGIDGTIKITGTYKNGKKNGSWLCTLTNYYYIVMTMSGTIHTNYLDGNREGSWTYSLSSSVSKFDVSGKETETGRLTFLNNVPTGEYFYSNAYKANSNAGHDENNTIIKGAFDKNGYKTGKWEIKTLSNNLPKEEIKKYKRGYCYWYISRISSTGEINEKFDSTEYANNYFNNENEVFKKGSIYYGLSTPKGTAIGGNYEKFIDEKGVNPFIDNSGDRFTIEENDGPTLAQFIGNLGWYAFLDGHFKKSLELSNKALTYDSTMLFVKLNIALLNLKQKNPEYLNDYLSAVNCCENIIGRKETLEGGLKDIHDFTEKEDAPNADQAIQIIETELERINIDAVSPDRSSDANGNSPGEKSGFSVVRGLSGRRPIHFPNMEGDFNENAKVYVDIKVNAAGTVTSAVVARGTTTPNTQLRSIAIEKAKQLKFPPSGNEIESGTILFNFVLRKLLASREVVNDNDKVIFTKVEIEASFPGGSTAWLNYIQKAILTEVNTFTQADYGTCVVRFIVDKTGKVSNVEATTMKGTKLAEVAVSAITNGPNWIPAQQNGKYVNAYRLQPVTLQNPDQ